MWSSSIVFSVGVIVWFVEPIVLLTNPTKSYERCCWPPSFHGKSLQKRLLIALLPWFCVREQMIMAPAAIEAVMIKASYSTQMLQITWVGWSPFRFICVTYAEICVNATPARNRNCCFTRLARYPCSPDRKLRVALDDVAFLERHWACAAPAAAAPPELGRDELGGGERAQ